VPDPVNPASHAPEICPIFSHPIKTDAQGHTVLWHEEPCRREKCMFYRRRDGACALTFVAEVVDEVETLKGEQRRSSAEFQALVTELGRRSEQSARQVADTLRGEVGDALRRVQGEVTEVKRAAGGLEAGMGESRAALVELVEYDRQRRRHEEEDRAQKEREQRKAQAVEKGREGRAHHRAGRREEAVAALTAARMLDPENAEIMSDLGAALLAAGRLQPAEEPLRRSIRMSDSFAPARANLGHLLLLRGEAEDAEKSLEEAARLDPNLAAAWNGLGNARWRLGRHAAAVEAWRRAWKLDPLCEEAERNLVRQQESL